MGKRSFSSNPEIREEFAALLRKIDELPEPIKHDTTSAIRRQLNEYIYPNMYKSKKKLPCICGHKQSHISHGDGYGNRFKKRVICGWCLMEGPLAKDDYEATMAWNEMITNMKGE